MKLCPVDPTECEFCVLKPLDRGSGTERELSEREEPRKQQLVLQDIGREEIVANIDWRAHGEPPTDVGIKVDAPSWRRQQIIHSVIAAQEAAACRPLDRVGEQDGHEFAQVVGRACVGFVVAPARSAARL